MLDQQLRDQLQTYLGMLKHPIQLIANLNETPASNDLRELISNICSLSPQVNWKEETSNERAPSFMIVKAGDKRGVRFAGLPLGHEFTSLVLALLWTT